MIYHGMQPNPSLSAGMMLTAWDMEKLKGVSLRPSCRGVDGRYFCIYSDKQGKHKLGEFTTIEDCNAAWDAEHDRRQNIKKRAPTGKGYSQISKLGGGYVYKSGVRVKVDGKTKFFHLGTHSNKDDARAVYLEAIDKINEGIFHEWRKTFVKC